MIEVKELTKKYGDHIAVSDLSFTIESGRIYGFLGPNGAGKSTTMNIMTGCLAATSGQVLFLLYVFAVPLLLPAATLGQVSGLDALQVAMLAFCCANTVIAYGCFAEALEHWEVSRVSAVVTIAPLVTLAGMHAASRLWPDRLAAEGLTWPSVVGALVVVAGAMTTAVAARTVTGGREPPSQPTA